MSEFIDQLFGSIADAVLRWVCDKLATTGLVDALSLLRGDDARTDYAWRIPYSDYTI